MIEALHFLEWRYDMTTRTNKQTHLPMDNDALSAPSNAVDDSVLGRSPLGTGGVDAAEQWRRIAEAAYFRAERRGFCPGCEMDDWLDAEREIGEQLGGGPSAAATASEPGIR
ncbi:MAG: DUF2934 domain-containing protein [Burkholderiales bacterium]